MKNAAPFRVRFNVPSVQGREFDYMQDAVRRGHISGDGHYTRQCQSMLEAWIGAPKALLTTSCTDALELAALLLDLAPGDEVIVPSFTFVSTANAFAVRGAVPVFADISPDTLNIDPESVESLLTSRTRAIVLMHYAGVACDVDRLSAIAIGHGASLIEDNAHGLFGSHEGRPLGSFGSFSTLSFHETKNLSCGEGGALIINDAKHIDRAEILREKGTDRSRFFRGLVDRYTWVDVGSSFLPSDLLAAFLFAQMEEADEIQKRRREIWQRYASELGGWAESNQFALPHVPAACQQPFHMFYLLAPDLSTRDRLLRHLAGRGILAVFHYVPLHSSPFGRRVGRSAGCPVAEEISGRLIRLPFYTSLTRSDQDLVIAAVREFSSAG
jgi:dTDP-4-amino-4,6-dideoxygalactose transaminase